MVMYVGVVVFLGHGFGAVHYFVEKHFDGSSLGFLVALFSLSSLLLCHYLSEGGLLQLGVNINRFVVLSITVFVFHGVDQFLQWKNHKCMIMIPIYLCSVLGVGQILDR